MKKNFSLFLALRYLRPKRTSVSIITLISILGVTLGVGILVLVIAVMTGFEAKLKETILGFEPHISLMQSGSMGDVADIEEDDPMFASRWDQVMEKFKTQPGVKAVFPYVSGNVLIQVGNVGNKRRLASNMRAVWPEVPGQIEQLNSLFGKDRDAPPLESDCVFISSSFANEIGVGMGDIIELVSSKNAEEVMNAYESVEEDPTIPEEEKSQAFRDRVEEVMLPVEVEITGIFDSAWFSNVVVVTGSLGQELYALGANVHGLAVQLDDPYNVVKFQKSLEKEVPPLWYLDTWIERNTLRFETVRNERAMMYFVLFFIVIVAAFSIMNTMITVTVQKRREIGVMKALGATEGQIIWVFLSQGIIVGLFGTAAGIGLGSLITTFRNEIREFLSSRFSLDIFPAAMYGIAEIPAKIVASDLIIISLGAFLLCALAALLPAMIAARLDAAKALRD